MSELPNSHSLESQAIPIFPLPNTVLFPGMVLPLNIFEPRYRQMMEDVIENRGTFGIQLCKAYNPVTMEGTPFDIGTLVEIIEVKQLEDGRYYAVTMGSQRYKVEQYDTKSQPYLSATVSLLVEEDQRKVSVNSTLVKDVKMFFHEAVRLSHKIMKEEFTPPEFPDTPEALSYFVAENLRGNLVLKQELLETTSTRTRLKLENEILNQVVKTLAAQAQIEEAFR